MIKVENTKEEAHMKRNIKYSLCLILILLLTLLSACTNKNIPDTIEPNPLIPSAILERKQSLSDSDTLFYIPNETVESGLMQTLLSFQDNFLLCGSDTTGYHLKLISAATGEELAANSFADMRLANVQICGSNIALTDWADGKILILDENLQEVEHYQVTCEYSSVYVSPDAEKVYVFLPETGIQVTTLATGETTMLLEHVANLYPSNNFQTKVTFSYTDLESQFDMYGAIDLEAGELLEFPFDGSFFSICAVNDTWFATQSGTHEVHYIGNRDSFKTFEQNDEMGNFTLIPDTGHLLMTSYNEIGFSKMAVYNTDGTCISECANTLEGAVVQECPLWSEADSGYFFIMIDPAGTDMLMFWDLNADCTGESLPFQDFQEEILPEGAVSKELYARARELSETYGVTIRIAEQISDEYTGYTAETCLNESMISKALNDVENALSVYPDRFFEQLLYGSIREVEIHLTGNLEMNDIPEDSGNGFTSFAGFASSGDSHSLIVLDIGASVESSLYHEIFHLIDDKLTFDAQLRPESNYSEEEWAKLNPDGFEYANQLYNLPDSFYDGKYEEWFTGYYARTNSKEDRATIMEDAMAGYRDMFILAPHRQAKLEYLSNCMRDTFDTTGWPEVTVWEDTLNRSR